MRKINLSVIGSSEDLKEFYPLFETKYFLFQEEGKNLQMQSKEYYIAQSTALELDKAKKKDFSMVSIYEFYSEGGLPMGALKNLSTDFNSLIFIYEHADFSESSYTCYAIKNGRIFQKSCPDKREDIVECLRSKLQIESMHCPICEAPSAMCTEEGRHESTCFFCGSLLAFSPCEKQS